MKPLEPVVVLEHAAKTYTMGQVKVPALLDINLRIFPGECVVILGPSGCGKSTLMNLIGGLDHPTEGKVSVMGKDISRLSDGELTRFRLETVGFIFQFFNLINTLTARENVQLAADLSKQPLSVMETLEAVGLGDRGHHFPSHLSGGEQQRVAIARALVKRAPILLCDEPTGELDDETGTKILDLLHRTTHEHGRVVLIVTHNAMIAEIADRVLRMRSGRLVSDEVNPHPVSPLEVHW